METMNLLYPRGSINSKQNCNMDGLKITVMSMADKDKYHVISLICGIKK